MVYNDTKNLCAKYRSDALLLTTVRGGGGKTGPDSRALVQCSKPFKS